MQMCILFLWFLLQLNIQAGTPELECFKQATTSGLEKSTALELCGQVDHSAPGASVSCYRAVVQAGIPGTEPRHAVQLCANARSNDPVACFKEAVTLHKLSPTEAVELCRTKSQLIRVPGSLKGKSSQRISH